MIQIDDLAQFHLKQALKPGRLPFLAKLLNDKGYWIHPLYSGLPSATPAVQGELFYGVKSIVPAFSFRDHRSKKIFRMCHPDAALDIERRLQRRGSGLLTAGVVGDIVACSHRYIALDRQIDLGQKLVADPAHTHLADIFDPFGPLDGCLDLVYQPAADSAEQHAEACQPRCPRMWVALLRKHKEKLFARILLCDWFDGE